MDLEDVSNKLRRNLVLLSFSILLTIPFQFSFETTSKIFGIINYSIHDQKMIWCLILLVLFYSYLRYWFDEATKDNKQYLYKEFDEIRLAITTSFLRWDIKRALKNNKACYWIEQLDNLDNEESQIAYKKRGRPSNVNVDVVLEQEPSTFWKGWVRIEYEIEWEDKGFYARTSGHRHPFKLPNWVRILVLFLARINLLIFSKSGVDFLWPNILAFMAFILSLKNIFCL